jgi:hypothetical protein
VSALQSGTFNVRASLNALISTKEVIVVPDGTYRLIGRVSDPVGSAGPVEGARVEVLEGPARGLSSGTSSTGQFALYGVSGDTILRVSKEGYQIRELRVVVTDHQVLDISMTALVPRPDVSGSYKLTIAAADTCGTALPSEALSRSYAAVVTQAGRALTVVLSAASFTSINGRVANLIPGTVDPSGVRLSLGGFECSGYYYGCGPSLLEQVAPSRVFMATGSARLAISPAILDGELDGAIEIYNGAGPGPGQFSRSASCRSSRHRVTLAR